MKKKVIIIGAAVILVVIVLWIFKPFGKKSSEYTFDTVKVTKGKISNVVTATGTIEAEMSVQVGTQVSGIIEKVYVDFNDKVKKGQLIGYTGYTRADLNQKPPEFPSGQLHFDFASSSMLIDRLCPQTYFDSDARKRIEAIWARVPSSDQFKRQYPEICNGIFKGKED